MIVISFTLCISGIYYVAKIDLEWNITPNEISLKAIEISLSLEEEKNILSKTLWGKQINKFMSYKEKTEEVIISLFFCHFRFGGCLFNKMNNEIGYYGKMLNFNDVEMSNWDPIYEKLWFLFPKGRSFCVYHPGPALPSGPDCCSLGGPCSKEMAKEVMVPIDSPYSSACPGFLAPLIHPSILWFMPRGWLIWKLLFNLLNNTSIDAISILIQSSWGSKILPNSMKSQKM